MAQRVIKKRKTVDNEGLAETFEQWSTTKKMAEEMGKRVSQLRERLVTALNEYGYQDDKGNIRLDLPYEIDGMGNLKYERRSRRVLDPDEAEKLLAKKGILEECQTTITVIDESAIEAAFYQKKITQKEYDAMFPVVESYALKAEKA